VYSLRVGMEAQPLSTLPLVLRAGLILEKSAFPTKTLTPLTLDSDKALVSVGVGYEVRDGLWVDVLYAHLFMRNVKVRDSVVYPQNPLRPARTEAMGDPEGDVGRPEPVGNGNYAMEADLVGLGVRWNI
jgi:long-subunit fatty acid transport protein